MHLRIGSRASKLALWQSQHTAARLRSLGHTVDVIRIRTTGDRMQDAVYASSHPVTPELDAKGIFIKEIEEAMLRDEIDLAVHSLKDLPTELDPRFTIAAVPERADPRDALLCPEWLQLHTLPEGARVGTTSPRRAAQLRAHRPDLRLVPIRGNIDTRLRKLAAGECDALVLACAGVDRLAGALLRPIELDPQHPEFGRPLHMECVTHAGHDHGEAHEDGSDELPGQGDWIRERFEPEVLCPAPGQGALALEALASAAAIIQCLQPLDVASVRFEVEAERWTLHALGGGCSLPVGALCAFDADRQKVLRANVTSPDGEAMIARTVRAHAEESAESLGSRMARELESAGALDLLNGRSDAWLDRANSA